MTENTNCSTFILNLTYSYKSISYIYSPTAIHLDKAVKVKPFNLKKVHGTSSVKAAKCEPQTLRCS